MNIIKVMGFLSAVVLTSQAYAYNCSGVAQYADGHSYNNGSIVQNGGSAYQCSVGGWCSVGGPYAPGTGWAWTNAWSNLGSCGTTGGSSSTTNNQSSSSTGTNTGGSCPNWAAGTNYTTGTVVKFNGAFYIAEHDNPGYDPTISTWFWDPVASCPGGNNNNSSSSTNTGGTCPNWVAGQSYVTGNVVKYSNGSNYTATHDNPGYDPTISTWFWSAGGTCSGSNNSSSSTGTNNGTGFAAIVSEAQFNQIYPGRNSFYTYSGLVNAAKSFGAFAGTGDNSVKIREAAAALANFSHETGGLVYVTEIAKGEYCGDWDNNPGTCPCEPGKWYYGRGPMQLSWNGNYCAAGDALGLDLRRNPEIVEQDATVAWKTAIWFWMTQTGAGNQTPHNAIVNGAGFGETIRAINGSLECNGGNQAQVQSRISEFNRILGILGGTAGPGAIGC